MPALDNEFPERMRRFKEALAQNGIDIALITDDDNVYYLTGYHDYLHMEFGRPTILIVPKDGESRLITPAMEGDMVQAAAWVDRISLWNDGEGEEWRADLHSILKPSATIGTEPELMPSIVDAFIRSVVSDSQLVDVSPVLSRMRMIKSPAELELARHTGEVAMAMMTAGRAAIRDNTPEYEVAIATSEAGTRKAAELLEAHYADAHMSPNTHFLQIMASGDQITKSHHRASTRIMKKGEPVFLCFCGMTNFHRFKLGFDRTFWIGEIAEKSQIELYKVATESQQAALDALRPGVTAESVHSAYAKVIRDAGFDYPFRCGRATGYSFLEAPQLVYGDHTVLEPGMVLAVDGSVCEPGNFRAQVGDSFIITESGYEQITDHPKDLESVIL